MWNALNTWVCWKSGYFVYLIKIDLIIIIWLKWYLMDAVVSSLIFPRILSCLLLQITMHLQRHRTLKVLKIATFAHLNMFLQHRVEDVIIGEGGLTLDSLLMQGLQIEHMYWCLGQCHWMHLLLRMNLACNLGFFSGGGLLPLHQLLEVGFSTRYGIPPGGPVVADHITDSIVVHQEHFGYFLRCHFMNLLEVYYFHSYKVRQLPLSNFPVLTYGAPGARQGFLVFSPELLLTKMYLLEFFWIQINIKFSQYW